MYSQGCLSPPHSKCLKTTKCVTTVFIKWLGLGGTLKINLVIFLSYYLKNTTHMFLVSIFVIFPRKEKGHIAEIAFLNFLHLIKIECKKIHVSLPAIVFILFTKVGLYSQHQNKLLHCYIGY